MLWFASSAAAQIESGTISIIGTTAGNFGTTTGTFNLNASALNSSASGGTLVLSGGTINPNIANTISSAVNVNSSLALSGINNYSGGLTISGAEMSFASPVVPIGTFTGAVSGSGTIGTSVGQINSGTLVVNNSPALGSVTYNLLTSGLTKTGVGNLTLASSTTPPPMGPFPPGANTGTPVVRSLLDQFNSLRSLYNVPTGPTLPGTIASGGSITMSGNINTTGNFGTLVVNGTNSYAGATTLNVGTLTGVGTIGGSLTHSGGTINIAASSTSAGTSTFIGPLSLNGGTVQYDVDGSQLGNDSVRAIGGFRTVGSTPIDLEFLNSGSVTSSTSDFTLFTYNGSSGNTATVSLAGGPGVVSAVPEPTAWTLGLIALTTLLLLSRRLPG